MKSGDLVVFSHSVFNRALIFFINGCAIFFYSRFLFKVSDVVADFIKINSGSEVSSIILLMVKISYFSGIIGGFLVLVLLMYTLVDVWGLKVIVTANSVIVLNSLIKLPGCGEMLGENIEDIKKGFFRFHVVSKNGQKISFSGVENIERLFYLIYSLKKKNN
jgi:hypothetical protein